MVLLLILNQLYNLYIWKIKHIYYIWPVIFGFFFANYCYEQNLAEHEYVPNDKDDVKVVHSAENGHEGLEHPDLEILEPATSVQLITMKLTVLC